MIGIDLIKTSRMASMIEKFGEKALKRFLSTNEINLVKNHKTASGFWAAKEACSKALGVGIGSTCNFHDIVISKTDKGAPRLHLSEKLIKEFKITDTSLSITHDGDYAIAVVAIEVNKNL
jgi:holo-[acyl-carrier protein] synthase